MAKLLAIGEHLEPFNSKKLDKLCEQFKNTLVDEKRTLQVFTVAQTIFEASGIDLDKKQYKSESETELLLSAYRAHSNKMKSIAEASVD